MFKLLFLFFFVHYATLISLIHANSPYGVTSVGTQSGASDTSAYDYDTTGNRLSGSYQNDNYTADYTMTYGLIGKPISINIPGVGTETILYRPGGRRYSRQTTESDKTFYVGDSEYRINADGTTKVIVYLHNAAYSPIVQVDTTSSTPNYKYFLQDHQGTTLVTVDNSEVKQHPKRYDPWGVPVAANGVHLDQSDIEDGSRTFTGHEVIKAIGFYHANGRLLDEMTGFVSPDPVLFSGNLVSHNSYAYALNSGPNHVDISGYAPNPLFTSAVNYIQSTINNGGKIFLHGPELEFEDSFDGMLHLLDTHGKSVAEGHFIGGGIQGLAFDLRFTDNTLPAVALKIFESGNIDTIRHAYQYQKALLEEQAVDFHVLTGNLRANINRFNRDGAILSVTELMDGDLKTFPWDALPEQLRASAHRQFADLANRIIAKLEGRAALPNNAFIPVDFLPQNIGLKFDRGNLVMKGFDIGVRKFTQASDNYLARDQFVDTLVGEDKPYRGIPQGERGAASRRIKFNFEKLP